jgi:hypothetical protein
MMMVGEWDLFVFMPTTRYVKIESTSKAHSSLEREREFIYFNN